MHRINAFTLIELLVVVAVIAILAAIAVPNFLEAQVRSKVSRTVADMASIRTALEAYAVDENTYPLNAGGLGLPGALQQLVRPRAYITSLPLDVFREGTGYHYLAGGKVTTVQQDRYGHYVLAGAGPDRTVETSLLATTVYDPTNGTVSGGDIVTTHRSADPAMVARAASASP